MTNHTHRNHYVPRWYQRRFLSNANHFYYLDLHPETITSNGRKHQRKAIRQLGPVKCFYEDDLYTMKLGAVSTDDVERRFFGEIDRRGEAAVEFFCDYSLRPGADQAYQMLMPYMDAQRLRTPKGLDWLKAVASINDKNASLLMMRFAYQIHYTMWSEGVWEVVSAPDNGPGFLVTDGPVTFYNHAIFPLSVACRYPFDAPLQCIGTRTLFPLSLRRCLIITHTEFIRDPSLNPRRPRTNPRSYEPTMFDLRSVQRGRVLELDEVYRINYILKKKANRFIAAVQDEWLYPEHAVPTTHWSKLDDDWFLFPNLYKVPFTSGVMVGFEDGTAWARDVYGRMPGQPGYEDPKQHDREWQAHRVAQVAWAVKRRGKSLARTDEWNEIHDKLMREALDQHDSQGRGHSGPRKRGRRKRFERQSRN